MCDSRKSNDNFKNEDEARFLPLSDQELCGSLLFYWLRHGPGVRFCMEWMSGSRSSLHGMVEWLSLLDQQLFKNCMQSIRKKPCSRIACKASGRSKASGKQEGPEAKHQENRKDQEGTWKDEGSPPDLQNQGNRAKMQEQDIAEKGIKTKQEKGMKYGKKAEQKIKKAEKGEKGQEKGAGKGQSKQAKKTKQRHKKNIKRLQTKGEKGGKGRSPCEIPANKTSEKVEQDVLRAASFSGFQTALLGNQDGNL